MKKTFFYSLLALTAVMLFAHAPSAEARGHHRSGTRVQVNVGNDYGCCRDAYVVRRYAPAVYAQPVIVQQAQYYTPVYAYQPAYVEEVYVAPAPRVRPFALGGLSFSWNFFR